jgi:hypothetical protein
MLVISFFFFFRWMLSQFISWVIHQRINIHQKEEAAMLICENIKSSRQPETRLGENAGRSPPSSMQLM